MLLSSPQTPQQILFVDDDPKICSGVQRLFLQNHVPWGCHFVNGAEEAVSVLTQQQIDAVISDIRMPGQDGFSLLSFMRKSDCWKDLPIVMLTGAGDPSLKSRALDLGATDLINKPVNPEELLARIRSVLQLKRYQDIIKQHNSDLEELVHQRTRSLEATRLDMIWRLARAAEFRSIETGNHVIRVAHYSHLLAQELGLDREQVEMVFLTSPLHDIGKIGIPDNILKKQGPLNHDEWRIMQQHCIIGRQLLSEPPSAGDNGVQGFATGDPEDAISEGNPLLKMAAEIAGSHHEQFAGGGYPSGLSGTDIPLAARIVTIADVYDALRNQRSYKARCTQEETLTLMRAENGSRFDPQIFEVFLACADRFAAVHDRYGDC